jgi:putative transcriptional regulator
MRYRAIKRQDFEQARRKPEGPAKSLLRIAEQHPEIFVEIG